MGRTRRVDRSGLSNCGLLIIIHQSVNNEMSNMRTVTIENPDATNNQQLPTTVVIRAESPQHPNLDALWKVKKALALSLYPAESDYSYRPDVLAAPNVCFLVAEVNAEFVGCGAAVNQGEYGEIKSMFVHEKMRGQRIGERLLRKLETYLREQKLPVAYLETGIDSHSALRLYERMGYTNRGPFGEYTNDPFCVFMEKAL